MGRLDDRIGKLEGLYLRPTPRRSRTAEELEREARIAELKHLYRTTREVAEHEAEEDSPQRLRALQEIEERVSRRRRAMLAHSRENPF
jgi:hypothetical protein